MKVTDKVVPNLVGVDIGCGTLTADLGHKPIDDIIKPISEAVDIVDVMRPIYNFKAS